MIIFAGDVGRLNAELDRFINELEPFGMGVGKVDIQNVMLEGDMIDQRTSHIEGCQMDDLILATDGLHNLPRRSWKVLHEQNPLTPCRAAQYGSPCDSPGHPVRSIASLPG